MIECSIRLPVTTNDQQPFAPSLLRDFETALLDLAGGFTIADATRGAWRDPETGRVYNETGTTYTVSVESWRTVTKFLAFAAQTRRLFDQKTVYIVIAGIAEILGVK